MTLPAGLYAVLGAFLAVVLTAAFPADGWAEARMALVIGNSDYANAPLRNPENDAGLMAETLGGLGFDVTLLTNLDQRALKRAIGEFGRKLDVAGRDAVGLFYYSGHGLQTKGQNYLIPVGAVIEHPMDIDIEGVRAQTVLDVLGQAGNRLNFVILDACRDNPVATPARSLSRGLAGMAAASGTLVAYATGPGQVAADGSGMFSPYTEALADVMETEGLPAETLFREVRTRVIAETNGVQVPWETSSLIGKSFYFNNKDNIPDVNKELESLPEFDVSSGSKGLESAPDAMVWAGILESDRAIDFKTFLDAFPNSPFAPFAIARLGVLADKGGQAVAPTGPVAVENMESTFVARKAANLRARPTSASSKLGTVAEGTPLAVTGKLRHGNWYRVADAGGGQAFVFGDLLAPIGSEELALWDGIKDSDEAAAFDAYLAAYPQGLFAGAARRLSAALREPEPTAPSLDEVSVQAVLDPAWPAGKVFRDCAVCPEMVVLPPATDLRAAGQGGTGRRLLAMGRFEVTFAEWDACVADGGCGGRRPDDEGWGRDRQPAVNLTWQDALSYAAWLSGKTGRNYRPPTEAEWEYAARAGTATTYAFGDTISMTQANFNGSFDRPVLADAYLRRTVPVGSYSANDFGLFDVHGNAWELAVGCIETDASAAATCGQPVLRGGGWDSGAAMLRSAFRGTFDAASANAVGLRLVRDLP